MDETWRWFGPEDIVSIDDIAQAGANGIVTSLHHIRPGEVWTKNEIDKRHKEISIFKNGSASKRKWRVVESLPVSEEIKQSGNWQCHIDNYIKSMQNIASEFLQYVIISCLSLTGQGLIFLGVFKWSKMFKI